MRISSGMIFDGNIASMQRQTASLLHTQQQVSTGQRILTPADDPTAAVQALEMTQAQDINTQYHTNQDNAKSALGTVDTQLASVSDLIQSAQEEAVQAGNGALSDSDRASIAQELRGQFEQLLGLANATDGNGQYLFSGYQGNNVPFSGNVASGVVYSGDDGERKLQVSASAQMPVSASGSSVFVRIRSGNGTFTTGFAATNQGTGLIETGSVLAPFNGHSYAIAFANGASGLEYTVTDTTTGATQAQNVPYQSGAAIKFDGTNSVVISGTPQSGDSFTIAPSRTDNSLFDTLRRLIGALETPASTANGGGTRIANEVSRALGDLSQAHDNILRVRASVGSRLNELDALQNVSDDLKLQYEAGLSRLQDVDYAEAVSQLTREQTGLQAAQKSFLNVSGLSLFNYL